MLLLQYTDSQATSPSNINRKISLKIHLTVYHTKIPKETKCVRAFVQRTGINCDQSLRSCDRVNISNQNKNNNNNKKRSKQLLNTLTVCFDTFYFILVFTCIFTIEICLLFIKENIISIFLLSLFFYFVIK